MRSTSGGASRGAERCFIRLSRFMRSIEGNEGIEGRSGGWSKLSKVEGRRRRRRRRSKVEGRRSKVEGRRSKVEGVEGAEGRRSKELVNSCDGTRRVTRGAAPPSDRHASRGVRAGSRQPARFRRA